MPVGQTLLMAVKHVGEDAPAYGVVEQVSPLVRRVMAQNPSVFTYHGTGTFIVGPPSGGSVAIVDPGPDDDEHVAALLAAVKGQTVSHLLITHTHPDHSPAAAAVKKATGAPTWGYGPHPQAAIDAHQKRVAQAIADGEKPEASDGEGAGDQDFVPDHLVTDGQIIAGPGYTFEALHTPGHISNHLCFAFQEEATLFSGDHVMGWSTTVIPAPDGDLNDYLANLRRLLTRSETLYRPTHGPAITEPTSYVANLITHREGRSEQILAGLADEPRTIMSLVTEMYAHVDEKLHKPAAASVYAHLLALKNTSRVAAEDPTDPETLWSLT